VTCQAVHAHACCRRLQCTCAYSWCAPARSSQAQLSPTLCTLPRTHMHAHVPNAGVLTPKAWRMQAAAAVAVCIAQHRFRVPASTKLSTTVCDLCTRCRGHSCHVQVCYPKIRAVLGFGTTNSPGAPYSTSAAAAAPGTQPDSSGVCAQPQPGVIVPRAYPTPWPTPAAYYPLSKVNTLFNGSLHPLGLWHGILDPILGPFCSWPGSAKLGCNILVDAIQRM
jgi:hypothetical protein